MTTGIMPPDPEAQRRFNKLSEQCRENVKVRTYFEALGYKVGWDFNHRGDGTWHEISDEEGLVAQIDYDVPLADIIEDMTCMAAGKQGTSKTDYRINTEDDVRFKKLCRRVAKNQCGGIQEDLPL